jgi:hypothetical protein
MIFSLQLISMEILPLLKYMFSKIRKLTKNLYFIKLVVCSTLVLTSCKERHVGDIRNISDTTKTISRSVPQRLVAESESEKQLREIVKKLNKQNSSSLDSLIIDSLTYFFDLGSLQYVKLRNDTADFKFFYDDQLNSHEAFFAISMQNKDTLDQFYLSGDKMIKWVNRSIDNSPDNGLFKRKEIIINGRAKDFITILSNFKLNTSNPHHQQKTKMIDELVLGLDKIKVHADTTKVVNIPEDGNHIEIEINYLDSLNNIIKSTSVSSGEHGSFERIKYFEGNDIVLEVEEDFSWVGLSDWNKALYSYYQKGKAFRKIFKESKQLGFYEYDLMRVYYKSEDRIEDY